MDVQSLSSHHSQEFGVSARWLRDELTKLRQDLLVDIRVLLQESTAACTAESKGLDGVGVSEFVLPSSLPSQRPYLFLQEGPRASAAAADSIAPPSFPKPFVPADQTSPPLPLDDEPLETSTAPYARSECKDIHLGTFGAINQRKDYDLAEEKYDVTNFYYKDGFCQALARSDKFANVTLFVISLNALYLGIDAEYNEAESPLKALWPFIICENVFCTFFVFEWCIRFGAFAEKKNCLRDAWFKFDSALVILMVAETWITPLVLSLRGSDGGGLPTGPLRLLRLLRLSRLARLARSIPELVTMVKGMMVATRAVGASLLTIVLLIYVFAIVIHSLLSEEESIQKNFGSVYSCMWTLFMDGTFMDNTGALLTGLLDSGKANCMLAVFVFLVFILLSAMTVMNMLIGVLCEVVAAVAAAEKDEAAIDLMKETVLIELKRFDDDGNEMISKTELTHLMRDWQALGVLQSLQIDTRFLSEAQRLLFADSVTEVCIEEIMEQMLLCRGDSPVTVRHLITMMALNTYKFEKRMYLHERRLGMQGLAPPNPPVVESQVNARKARIEMIKNCNTPQRSFTEAEQG